MTMDKNPLFLKHHQPGDSTMHSRTFSCGEANNDTACNLENQDEELEMSPRDPSNPEINHDDVDPAELIQATSFLEEVQ